MLSGLQECRYQLNFLLEFHTFAMCELFLNKELKALLTSETSF